MTVICFQEMAIDETTTGIEEVPTASNTLPGSSLNELFQQEVQLMFVCEIFSARFAVVPKKMKGANASKIFNVYPSWTWTANWPMIKKKSYLTSFKFFLAVKMSHMALEAGWATRIPERRNAHCVQSSRVRLLL